VLLLIPALAGADAGDGGGSERESRWQRQANPLQVQTDYETGYRHVKAGQYKEAIKVFKRVLKEDPKHAMAYTNMAYSHRKLGQYDQAISLYEKALKLEPNLAEAHEYMGEALLALGKVDEAKQHLAILEQLDPKLAEELRAEIARQRPRS
jgi:tetratricopeptide (TPR) repeat protein